MSDHLDQTAKIFNAASFYRRPADVLKDTSLSDGEKAEVLATLEQDARGLSQAATEGMSGGERTNLHEVLGAEAALAATAASELALAGAYMAVLRDLRLRRTCASESATRERLDRAVIALEQLADSPEV